MKKKLIEVDPETWSLLKTYANFKNIGLPTALDNILKEKLLPIKKALEGL